MSVIVALTVGLVIWIAAWAFGVKAIDAFLITIALTTTAAAARIAAPFVRQQLGKE